MNYNYNYITSSSSNADRYLFNNSFLQLGSFINPSEPIPNPYPYICEPASEPSAEPSAEPDKELIDIYVNSGSFSSPYYNFYIYSAGTLLEITKLNLNKNYRFNRLNNTKSHPFYISDKGYKEPSSNKISITGDGSPNFGITGSHKFNLQFLSLTRNDNLYYFCTAHSNMKHKFSLESSP